MRGVGALKLQNGLIEIRTRRPHIAPITSISPVSYVLARIGRSGIQTLSTLPKHGDITRCLGISSFELCRIFPDVAATIADTTAARKTYFNSLLVRLKQTSKRFRREYNLHGRWPLQTARISENIRIDYSELTLCQTQMLCGRSGCWSSEGTE